MLNICYNWFRGVFSICFVSFHFNEFNFWYTGSNWDECSMSRVYLYTFVKHGKDNDNTLQCSAYAVLTDQVNYAIIMQTLLLQTQISAVFINSTWKWWTYCDLAPPFLLYSSWEMLCQKYLAASPQHSVPPDTDSCLNYKGSNVSNEPTEISSYRATLSYPEQPLWP